MGKRDTMLAKLEELYKEHPEKFRALLPVKASGGHRIWLAKTREEVERSGKSTDPRDISSSGLDSVWACSNGSGPQYASLPLWVMDQLGYSDTEVADFVRELIGPNAYRTVK